VVSFMPLPFTVGERALVTHWMGGWMGPSLSGRGGEEKNIPAPVGNRKPVVQPVA